MELLQREMELVRNVFMDTEREVLNEIRNGELEQEDLEFMFGYLKDIRKMVDNLHEELEWSKETWEDVIPGKKKMVDKFRGEVDIEENVPETTIYKVGSDEKVIRYLAAIEVFYNCEVDMFLEDKESSAEVYRWKMGLFNKWRNELNLSKEVWVRDTEERTLWEIIMEYEMDGLDDSFVIRSTSEYNKWLDRAEELSRPQLEELLRWNQKWMSELLMEWVDLDEEEQVMDDDTSSNIWILKQDRYRLYKLVENRE